MRFSAVAAALLPVGVAFAQTTHVVKVGGSGALTYTPNQYVLSVIHVARDRPLITTSTISSLQAHRCRER